MAQNIRRTLGIWRRIHSTSTRADIP